MSDWTPTTEQVRAGYRFNPEDDYYNPLQAGANAERAGRDFDRWLEQVKAEAWDEGRIDGQINAENEAAIAYGTRQELTNPYRKEQDQ